MRATKRLRPLMERHSHELDDTTAQAGTLKKSLLELGGNDAFIVLADANIDLAVHAGIEARFQNAGQICLAAKRFILEKPIAEEFTRKFVAAAKQLKVGDPLDSSTTIGQIGWSDCPDPHGRRDLFRDSLRTCYRWFPERCLWNKKRRRSSAARSGCCGRTHYVNERALRMAIVHDRDLGRRYAFRPDVTFS